VDQEELIKFESHPFLYPDPGILKTLQDKAAVDNLAHLCGKPG